MILPYGMLSFNSAPKDFSLSSKNLSYPSQLGKPHYKIHILKDLESLFMKLLGIFKKVQPHKKMTVISLLLKTGNNN